ncbi:MAG: hypothetical protein L6R39_004960, partial [Caloplaca ligustica]
EICAEDGVRERVAGPEGGGEGGVQSASERGGIAGLLVEEEDARLLLCQERGRGRGHGGDVRSEPRCREPDALERVRGIDMPRQALLAADLASAGPARLLEAAREFLALEGIEEGCAVRLCFDVGGDEFDGQAGVDALEGGVQAEFDGLQGAVFGDDGKVDGFLAGALAEDCFCGSGLGDGVCGGTGFHDAGLVPGDFFNGVAEELGVVYAEACDAGDGGMGKDVCAVVFTADAAFDDCYVDVLAHKCWLPHTSYPTRRHHSTICGIATALAMEGPAFLRASTTAELDCSVFKAATASYDQTNWLRRQPWQAKWEQTDHKNWFWQDGFEVAFTLWQRQLAKRDRGSFSEVLFATGDVMAQQAVEKVGVDKHNFARTGRMALYGGAVFGPAATTWFKFLQQRIKFKNENVTIAARVLTDQTVFASTNLFCFLSSMAIMEGTSPKDKLDSTYWTALQKNWMLWPAVQAVNFKLVPLEHRVLLVNVVSLGWNCYLSYINSKGK